MLTDEQIAEIQRGMNELLVGSRMFARAIESAATAPLLERIAEQDRRIAEFISALDEEKVVSHIGVFNLEDDPRKAVKDLMLWNQGVGDYFAAEKAKERIAELERKSSQDDETVVWQAEQISKHLDRIAELGRELEQARQQMERQKDEWLSWEAKRKTLEAAAVELEAVRKDAGWRPIETAPKDGTAVLVWNKGCGHWLASFRLPMRGEPQCESHYVKEWRDGGGRWATPALWMPLPPVAAKVKTDPNGKLT